MPTTYRFPVAVWQSPSGDFTASVVEFNERAAVGKTVREALEQLKELLEWLYQKESWRDPPELKEPELQTLKFPIRAEYHDERCSRRYPLNEPFELRVPCVIGKQAGGLRLVSMPLLGLRLSVSDNENLQSLLQHAVQRKLEALTPQQLSRQIAPAKVFLDDVFVSIDPSRSFKRQVNPTLTLKRIADPLGDPKVRSLFGRAWERDREVQNLVKQLQHERGSWLLLGEHGSGKTTVLCEAIRHIERQLRIDERDSDDFWNQKPSRRFWQTSAGRLISGMKYLGQWEERLEQVIRELTHIEGVLCVESLLDLVRVGGCEPTSSLAAFCMPYMQRGELRIIAEVAPDELDACRRLLPGLADLFQVVTLPTLDRSRAVEVLKQLESNESAQRRVDVDELAAPRCVQLFQRFEPYHALPGEVVPFWRDLLAKPNGERVTAEQVTRRFIQRTGLPELFLRDELTLTRESVATQFAREVIGQPTACETAADVVISFKAGMNDARRPLGTLLFCGPTGVGKTELAKAISRFLFGGSVGWDQRSADPPTNAVVVPFEVRPSDSKEDRWAGAALFPPYETSDAQRRLIRLDMSEYSGAWAADRLLTQANGEPSDFIQQIRRQPFCVLLFDEIEKAHPSVFDVLMNVFDEGRLTDRFGRVTYFRSAVIVLTSNLGASSGQSVGFGDRSTSNTARHLTAARQFFRPEFFNRLDSVVTFEPLTSEVVAQITEKELREISQREGLRKRGLQFCWTDEVIAHLAKAGFDPRYGARPLQRTLETEVVAPLSRLLVERSLAPASRVEVRVVADGTLEWVVD